VPAPIALRGGDLDLQPLFTSIPGHPWRMRRSETGSGSGFRLPIFETRSDLTVISVDECRYDRKTPYAVYVVHSSLLTSRSRNQRDKRS
jgi:hypothetical protein